MRRCFQKSKNNESGQSLVELALFLPILLLLVLGIIQFGVILGGQITVTSAAREGARTAVVGGDDGEVKERVKDFAKTLLLEELDDNDITITPDQNNRVSGGELSVHVSGRVPIIVPTFGILSGSEFSVTSEAVMRVERSVLASNTEEEAETEPEPEPLPPLPGPGEPPIFYGEPTVSWTGGPNGHLEVTVSVVDHEGPYSVGTLLAQLEDFDGNVIESPLRGTWPDDEPWPIFEETQNTQGIYQWEERFFGSDYPKDPQGTDGPNYTLTIFDLDGEPIGDPIIIYH